MLVTSSTTSVAFLANAFSPLMPIKAFGIFAGIIIPLNFLLVIFIFPSAVIMQENIDIYFKDLYERKFNSDKVVKISSANDSINDQKQTEQYSTLEAFFRNQWNAFVRKFRWIIVSITLIWIIFAAI